jgi:hypothetical protein
MKNLYQLAAVLGCAWGLAMPAVGAVLTSVPMQGSMVMPAFSYSAADGTLRVLVDPTIPQLTPLLVSNPGDSFDPADPWFEALDPSRQGLAFSKRYGFVMGTETDPLPAGTGISIRKLSGSPQLGLYRAHAMSLPHRWEPLFGTAGTSDTFSWNGSMFHPCAAAPAGTNEYTATFEGFLVETNSGAVVAGSSTGPFVLNWTSVPDGRPTIEIAPRIVVSWPQSATNYVLEGAESLSPCQWTVVTNAPVMLEGCPAIVLERGEARRFFRMRMTP